MAGTPHVEHQVAVFELRDGAFVAVALPFAADGPRLAVVVGVDQVRIGTRALAVLEESVVAGDYDAALVSALLKLDGVAGACGVPRPVFAFDGRGDLAGGGPSQSVVVGVEHEDAAGVLGRTGVDVLFVVRTVVPSGEQQDAARFAVYDRRRVAADVARVVPDGDDVAPRAAAVGRAAQYEVDVARIAAAVFAGFGEGQHGALLGPDRRRDAVGVEAVVAFLVDRRRVDGLRVLRSRLLS